MDRAERIQAMEEKLNRVREAVGSLERALDAYADVRQDLAALGSYLGSPQRRDDLAADEAGLLPADLRRGVLSEDGIYDVLTADDELRRRMRSLGRKAR